MSRRERQPERPRPKTELQLYRHRMREEALERRDKMLERAEAQLARRRGLREASRDEALAEARETLERVAMQRETATRLEYHDPERSGIWSGLALGLGVAALVGVAGVLVYLLVRKKDGQVVGVQGLGYATPIIIGGGTGMSAELTGSLQSIASSLGAGAGGQWNSSVMKSFTLPSLNDRTRGAIRVAQATDVAYEVMLRTLGIPGTYAVFSLSTNELDSYRGNPATQPPVGETVIVPTSEHTWLTLKPKEVLYAKGSSNGVIVSVTANQAAGLRGLR